VTLQSLGISVLQGQEHISLAQVLFTAIAWVLMLCAISTLAYIGSAIVVGLARRVWRGRKI
jgi:hypothetical protein